MSYHQNKIDNHCDNIWEDDGPETGAVISGVGMLLLITIIVIFITMMADVPGVVHDVTTDVLNDITSFNLIDWLMALPEWSDYVR